MISERQLSAARDVFNLTSRLHPLCELMNKPSKELVKICAFVLVNQVNAICRCKFGGIVLMSDEKRKKAMEKQPQWKADFGQQNLRPPALQA